VSWSEVNTLLRDFGGKGRAKYANYTHSEEPFSDSHFVIAFSCRNLISFKILCQSFCCLLHASANFWNSTWYTRTPTNTHTFYNSGHSHRYITGGTLTHTDAEKTNTQTSGKIGDA